MGVDGFDVLRKFIDQDDLAARLGQLPAQHPTNSASPTHHKAHRLLLRMKGTPCEGRLYRKAAGKSNGSRERAGEGMQKVDDGLAVWFGVRNQEAVATAHEGEQ